MKNRRADRNGIFLPGGDARQSPMSRSGKSIQLIKEQKDRIEATLMHQQMTISDIAAALDLSNDTIRNRLNEMMMEGRPIRVSGWKVLDTTMVRIWGIGTEQDEPKPVRVRVAAIRKRRREEASYSPVPATSTVHFRREGMDEWLFRIKELR